MAHYIFNGNAKISIAQQQQKQQQEEEHQQEEGQQWH